MSSVQRRQHVSHTHGGGCPHFAHLFGAFLFGGESQKSHLSSPRAAWNKNWIPDVAPDPVSSWVWTARTTEAGPGLETPVNSHQALPTCRAGRGQPRPRGPRVCGTGPRAFGPVPAPSGVWWPVPQESPCAASVPRQPKQPRRGRLPARGLGTRRLLCTWVLVSGSRAGMEPGGGRGGGRLSRESASPSPSAPPAPPLSSLSNK